jgi:hypothetical protein
LTAPKRRPRKPACVSQEQGHQLFAQLRQKLTLL